MDNKKYKLFKEMENFLPLCEVASTDQFPKNIELNRIAKEMDRELNEEIFGGIFVKWISVKDVMPEDFLPDDSKRQRITVLVCVNGKTVSSASRVLATPLYRRKEDGEYELVSPKDRKWKWSKDKCNVTHWMLLPKPPKGD